MANDHTGFTGTWETWQSPEEDRTGATGTNSRMILGSVRPNGDEQETLQGIAKRRKRSAARGRQEVAAPHSSDEAGERPFRTPWSEGGAALWTGSWNHAEDTVPHQRVTAKRPGRVRDSDSTT